MAKVTCDRCETGELLPLGGSLGYPVDLTPPNAVYCDKCGALFRVDVKQILDEKATAEAELAETKATLAAADSTIQHFMQQARDERVACEKMRNGVAAIKAKSQDGWQVDWSDCEKLLKTGSYEWIRPEED